MSAILTEEQLAEELGKLGLRFNSDTMRILDRILNHCAPADEGMADWFSCNSGGDMICTPMQAAFLAVADGKDWVEAGRPFFDGVIAMLDDWALDTYYPNGCPVCSCGDEESGDLDPDEAAAVALDRLAERLRERAAKRKQLAATGKHSEGKQ